MSYRSYIKAGRGLTAAVLCIALLISLAVTCLAEDTGSLTLTLLDRQEQTPVGGMVFRLYKFASAELKNGGYVYTYDIGYDTCGMDIDDLSDVYLPFHISAHAQLNECRYTEKTTDTAGTAVFDGLDVGAYLVLPVESDAGYILPTPFIVTVPMWDGAEEKWQFDINASPKTEAEPEDEELAYLSVKKEWTGEGEHPHEVKVALLKDSVIEKTVILNADNNWRHRWDGLDRSHSWSVVEIEVPEGYEVGYNASEMTVTVVNAKLEYDNPPDDFPDETTADKDSEETTPRPDTTTARPDQLIQTGQLNWPVPVLSIVGLIIFALGWALCNLGSGKEGYR